MDRTDALDNIARRFTDGNPQAGQEATVVGSKWLNGVQEELVGVIEWSGQAPSDADNTQLVKAINRAVGSGAVVMFPLNAAPIGYLKANGALISRATYSRLFTVMGTTFGIGDGATTFALPDLRGEFLRCWDDARGVDAGRAIGTAQADLFKSHSHPSPTPAGSTAGAYEVAAPAGVGGGYQGYDYGAQSAPTDVTGGAETRPRNVALLACIKF